MAIVAFVIVLLIFLNAIVKFFQICTFESAINYFTKNIKIIKEQEKTAYTVHVILAFIIAAVLYLTVLYFLYGLI